jgi:hypothetical protein
MLSPGATIVVVYEALPAIDCTARVVLPTVVGGRDQKRFGACLSWVFAAQITSIRLCRRPNYAILQ